MRPPGKSQMGWRPAFGTETFGPAFWGGWGSFCPPDGPHQAVGRGSGGLTGREAEVAALVSRGLTNRAIAEALGISERTAEAHVASIMAKLGFNTRAQVAVWAAEQGLNKTAGPGRPS